MSVNINRLKGKIVEKEKTGAEIAKELGINQSTYYRKLSRGGATFTLDQASKLSEILDLNETERTDIFLLINSRKREQLININMITMRRSV